MMPRPFLVSSQSNYLIQITDKKFTFLMANSAGPHQLASGFSLQRRDISGLSRTRVNMTDIHNHLTTVITLFTGTARLHPDQMPGTDV